MEKSILIISYMRLRQLIGLLGVLLPFVCVFGGMMFAGSPTQQSISAYYHTNMRDIFVGLMVCTSAFLFTYKGYDWKDRAISLGMAISALFIALFPCFSPDIVRVGMFQLTPAVSNIIHSISAITFFGLMSANCLFIFTLSDGNLADKKKCRNVIYRICGWAIPASAILLLIGNIARPKGYFILVFESIMLLAFGVAWLTKGQAILKDL